ncbi:MAG: CBS domain-containing protein, partial [Gemmatimonadetes bacterium]|nr:CBS domain-containing protein [Gemmatimonadota bacterium]NIQ52554.1 CBS domain-containing protein [Gemmatimonadota bacterium]NIU72692.1 CBS domain-containing protein [Gammaproteobacteria bacterium]NIX43098.1 CBS domain-containing protein [Gemmatimonadota bacterium]NIY07260.1 CBS domain-containing protein [Gemmatimonadota bacterium]
HRPGEPEEAIPVAAVMERDPPTIGPDAPLLDAVRLMLDHGLSALPVTDGLRPLGVLSEHDILELTGRLMERHPERW